MLDDYGIKAQLTATQRTGVHKYTFPKGKDGHLILDLVHGIYNYDGKVCLLYTSGTTDGVMKVKDDGRIPPMIDLRICAPGAAKNYGVGPDLGGYIPNF